MIVIACRKIADCILPKDNRMMHVQVSTDHMVGAATVPPCMANTLIGTSMVTIRTTVLLLSTL